MNVLWLCRNILHSLLSSFSAHSTKGAATSKAWAASVNVDTILAKVGWAWESTFEKFYRGDTEGPSVESPANRQGIVRTSWNPQSKFQKSIHIHWKAFTSQVVLSAQTFLGNIDLPMLMNIIEEFVGGSVFRMSELRIFRTFHISKSGSHVFSSKLRSFTCRMFFGAGQSKLKWNFW